MYLASEALSENCDEDAVLATASLKSVFLDVEVDDMKPVGGHTHGVSAAVRSTASNLIDCVTKAAGRNPVYYQGSSADVRKGRQISRSYFWAKDFMAPAMPPVADADVVAMVDVDYYVDMERKLVGTLSHTSFTRSNHQPFAKTVVTISSPLQLMAAWST